ncbi:hypothetical protein QMA03_07780 [Pseudoalteromonas sp. APC 3356]|jgi:hypothetical protein|uniref:hypothetical protein n=1 Tax=unclassified Pseudoalteromonas TaxID=194690 RepID=UPI0002E2066A|nr:MULTISPECIES: hypothetical protein [unclassified Pseudoalteromonas]MDN3434308.1 hypothetical protein [Pseudoalteromonas sp. APC 3356]
MAIGGYNQLSLISLNTQLGTEAYKFQSARAALYAYLSATKIKTLYVPNYICDSIFPALKSLAVEIKFYSINERLLPIDCPKLTKKSDSRILLVNYFGLLNKQIKKLTAVEPELFIVDNSQALFCEHIEGTTSIYSPRKFLGIPDGGFLRTAEKINMPETMYDASENVGHLLLRAAGDVQAGYARFLTAEQALECFIPKKISVISAHLIKCADLNAIKVKRRRNYKILYNKFKLLNQLQFPINDHVPLCYPLKLGVNVTKICKELISSGIYLPRYWCSDYSGEVGINMFESTLFLPIDERICTTELLQLVKLIRDKL